MARCVDKTYKCGTKKTRNYQKVLGTTREEAIFHVGNQVPKFEWGVPKFDEGPPLGPEPLKDEQLTRPCHISTLFIVYS